MTPDEGDDNNSRKEGIGDDPEPFGRESISSEFLRCGTLPLFGDQGGTGKSNDADFHKSTGSMDLSQFETIDQKRETVIRSGETEEKSMDDVQRTSRERDMEIDPFMQSKTTTRSSFMTKSTDRDDFGTKKTGKSIEDLLPLEDIFPGLKCALLAEYDHFLIAWKVGLKQGLTASIKLKTAARILDELCVTSTIMKERFGNMMIPKEYDKEKNRLISLRDLDDYTMSQIVMIREFITENFPSISEFFAALDTEIGTQGELTEKEFTIGMQKLGFTGDVPFLFKGLDSNRKGCISAEEFMFLEQDLIRRSLALARIQGQESEHRRMLRLKSRRKKAMAIKRRQARKNFLVHCIKKFGNLIRAWRQKLDLDGDMEVTKKEFFKFCTETGFNGDARLAWSEIDTDGNGSTYLEELDMYSALMLAQFKDFVDRRVGHWRELFTDSLPTRIQNSTDYAGVTDLYRKITYGEFVDKLMKWGFQFREPLTAHCLKLLFNSLDVRGCGILRYQDITFLQKWDPPRWMLVSPDADVTQKFRMHLMRVYGTFIGAWRRCFDRDGSNRVSWQEFFNGALESRYPEMEKVPTIWRTLDDDLSGWISLRELDAIEADILETFIAWAQSKFGDVTSAFMALDVDSSGRLSYTEFRAAVRLYGFQGNTRHLFNALDHSGERRLTIDKFEFLDYWDLPDEEEREAEKFLTEWHMSKIHGKPNPLIEKQKRRTITVHTENEFPSLWCVKVPEEVDIRNRTFATMRYRSPSPNITMIHTRSQQLNLPPLLRTQQSRDVAAFEKSAWMATQYGNKNVFPGPRHWCYRRPKRRRGSDPGQAKFKIPCLSKSVSESFSPLKPLGGLPGREYRVKQENKQIPFWERSFEKWVNAGRPYEKRKPPVPEGEENIENMEPGTPMENAEPGTPIENMEPGTPVPEFPDCPDFNIDLAATVDASHRANIEIQFPDKTWRTSNNVEFVDPPSGATSGLRSKTSENEIGSEKVDNDTEEKYIECSLPPEDSKFISEASGKDMYPHEISTTICASSEHMAFQSIENPMSDPEMTFHSTDIQFSVEDSHTGELSLGFPHRSDHGSTEEPILMEDATVQAELSFELPISVDLDGIPVENTVVEEQSPTEHDAVVIPAESSEMVTTEKQSTTEPDTVDRDGIPTENTELVTTEVQLPIERDPGSRAFSLELPVRAPETNSLETTAHVLITDILDETMDDMTGTCTPEMYSTATDFQPLGSGRSPVFLSSRTPFQNLDTADEPELTTETHVGEDKTVHGVLEMDESPVSPDDGAVLDNPQGASSEVCAEDNPSGLDAPQDSENNSPIISPGRVSFREPTPSDQNLEGTLLDWGDVGTEGSISPAYTSPVHSPLSQNSDGGYTSPPYSPQSERHLSPTRLIATPVKKYRVNSDKNVDSSIPSQIWSPKSSGVVSPRPPGFDKHLKPSSLHITGRMDLSKPKDRTAPPFSVRNVPDMVEYDRKKKAERRAQSQSRSQSPMSPKLRSKSPKFFDKKF